MLAPLRGPGALAPGFSLRCTGHGGGPRSRLPGASRLAGRDTLRRALALALLATPVRPGRVQRVRPVPQDIARPPYVDQRVELDLRSGLPRHPFMYCVEVKSPEQVESMRKACGLAREALMVAREAIRPGVSTDDVDAAVHEFVVAKQAYPSPLGYLGFPKSVSTSVNDVIAHGIPDDRPLEDGDILNVDVTVFAEGHHGDSSCMFTVGSVDDAGLALCKAAQEAMMAGIQACGPGRDFRAVGRNIQLVADRYGCYVSDLFLGHGVGSYFHGKPEVIPYENNQEEGEMLPGMTFTVEPVLVEDQDDSYWKWEDGWTFQTHTNARSA
ncbi:unnamed protein product, partial [Effrenium voratum]